MLLFLYRSEIFYSSLLLEAWDLTAVSHLLSFLLRYSRIFWLYWVIVFPFCPNSFTHSYSTNTYWVPWSVLSTVKSKIHKTLSIGYLVCHPAASSNLYLIWIPVQFHILKWSNLTSASGNHSFYASSTYSLLLNLDNVPNIFSFSLFFLCIFFSLIISPFTSGTSSVDPKPTSLVSSSLQRSGLKFQGLAVSLLNIPLVPQT